MNPLDKLLKVINTQNIVTPDEIEAVLSGITNLLEKYKSTTESLTDEKLNEMDKTLSDYSVYLDKVSLKLEKSQEKAIFALTEDVNTAVKNIQSLQKELKSKLSVTDDLKTEISTLTSRVEDYISNEDSRDESLIGEVLKRLPEEKVITGEFIVDEINNLPTDDEALKIDAAHIKNLPKVVNQAVGVSNKYLDQLLDVDLSGVTKTNGKYVLGSGGGGGGGITATSTDTLTNKTLDSYTNYIHADGIHLRVKATENIARGDVLKFVGFNSGEQAIEVAKRNSNTVPAIGIADETLSTGSFGMALSNGLFKNINTSSFSEGSVLYPNTTGGFTTTPTIANSNYNQQLAYVVRSHTKNGEIMVNIGAGHDLSSQVAYDNTTSGLTATNVKSAIDEVVATKATPADITTAINALVDTAPGTLDTLNELAAALGDDPNFATTVTTSLGNKVDKITGKGLSTEDYSTSEKAKLAGIANGAEVNVNPDWNAISGDAQILNKPTIPTLTSQLTNDSGFLTTAPVTSVAGKTGAVTLVKADVGLGNVDNTSDANKPISTATQTALNAKQATLVSATNIKTINGNSLLGSGDLTISGGGGSPVGMSITSMSTTSQSVPDGTLTKITGWATPAYINGVTFSTNTVTVSTAGFYSLAANILWDSSASFYHDIRLMNTGLTVAYIVDSVPAGSGSGYAYHSVATNAYLNAGDTVEVYVIQSSGAAKTINPFSGGVSFSVIKIA